MNPLIQYSLIGILFAFFIVKGIAPAYNTLHSDFVNYYVSAKMIVEGKSTEKLYDNSWFLQKINDYGIETPGKFSPFPPITAWIMTPLTIFNPLNAQRTLIIINLLSIAACAFLTSQLAGWKFSGSLLLILGGGLSTTNNIAFGQIYLIITAFLLLSFWLYQRGHTVVPGIILGIFAAVKYFPIVILAGFVLIGALKLKSNATSRPRTSPELQIALAGLITLIVLYTFQLMWFGSNVMTEYFQSAFIPHLNGVLQDQGLFSFQYQSWDNLFRNMFIYNTQYNPDPIMNWPMGLLISKGIICLLIIISLGFTLFQFRRAEDKIRIPVCVAMLSLAAFVVLPASATYHFAMILFPLVLILRLKLSPKLLISIIGIYCLIGFIPYSFFFALGKSLGLIFAYPRLWLVSILYTLSIVGLFRSKKQLQHTLAH